MLTASMLNHPSTNPNVFRKIYIPRLRMEFEALPHPVQPSLMPEDKKADYVTVEVLHPNNTEIVFDLQLLTDDVVVIVTDDED